MIVTQLGKEERFVRIITLKFWPEVKVLDLKGA